MVRMRRFLQEEAAAVTNVQHSVVSPLAQRHGPPSINRGTGLAARKRGADRAKRRVFAGSTAMPETPYAAICHVRLGGVGRTAKHTKVPIAPGCGQGLKSV
mmetsp:Transcript_44750/g.124438  ORF Transcript_44750/g.124438 Transcript_44750/m.124438 type:complete len:101 (-) Transcript_44750:20-322(-)